MAGLGYRIRMLPIRKIKSSSSWLAHELRKLEPVDPYFIYQRRASEINTSDRAMELWDEMKSYHVAPTANIFNTLLARIIRHHLALEQVQGGILDEIFAFVESNKKMGVEPTMETYMLLLHLLEACPQASITDIKEVEKQQKLNEMERKKKRKKKIAESGNKQQQQQQQNTPDPNPESGEFRPETPKMPSTAMQRILKEEQLVCLRKSMRAFQEDLTIKTAIAMQPQFQYVTSWIMETKANWCLETYLECVQSIRQDIPEWSLHALFMDAFEKFPFTEKNWPTYTQMVACAIDRFYVNKDWEGLVDFFVDTIMPQNDVTITPLYVLHCVLDTIAKHEPKSGRFDTVWDWLSKHGETYPLFGDHRAKYYCTLGDVEKYEELLKITWDGEKEVTIGEQDLTHSMLESGLRLYMHNRELYKQLVYYDTAYSQFRLRPHETISFIMLRTIDSGRSTKKQEEDKDFKELAQRIRQDVVKRAKAGGHNTTWLRYV
eukprot:NODE_98_length_1632_cov_474.854485_g96_i0.p1 GENE.NODE_98_length_1632_cov_474.854485_g96_i0~~NODE_98_length_1632_cov_474.854485_g96_i0.p1  ORF type:complete len:489 (-),score=93.69 NODE_98_length_1632_cov_474.854485_g96_i0:25-1491(-)